MSHSLTKIWIHSVFGTKNREPMIKEKIMESVHTHIQEQLEDLDCRVRIVNGTENHIHSLFLLSREKTISQIMKSVKGETSHWINHQDMISRKFSWQVGYGAFSVSESNVGKVEAYIQNQKEHHKTMTFNEEYARFMKHHGIEVNR